MKLSQGLRAVTGVFLLCATLTVCADDSKLIANIGVSSNKIYRGVANDKAIVSGGMDYFHESGMYAGVWLGNTYIPTYQTVLKDIGNPNDKSDDQYEVITKDDPDYEVALCAGYSHALGDFSYTLGVMHTRYPLHPEVNFDYSELVLKGSFKQFSASVNYDFAADDKTLEGSVYYSLGMKFNLPKEMNLGLTVGRYNYKPEYAYDDYNHVQLDIGKSLSDGNNFMLSIAKAGEAANGDKDTRLIVSWTKMFY